MSIARHSVQITEQNMLS